MRKDPRRDAFCIPTGSSAYQLNQLASLLVELAGSEILAKQIRQCNARGPVVHALHGKSVHAGIKVTDHCSDVEQAVDRLVLSVKNLQINICTRATLERTDAFLDSVPLSVESARSRPLIAEGFLATARRIEERWGSEATSGRFATPA